MPAGPAAGPLGSGDTHPEEDPLAEIRRPRSVSQSFLLGLLRSQLDGLVPGEWRPLDIVDLGGGTGGIASALAPTDTG